MTSGTNERHIAALWEMLRELKDYQLDEGAPRRPIRKYEIAVEAATNALRRKA